MKLLTRDVPPRSAWALEQSGIHPLLARLYAARGVQAPDELDDALARLLPPNLLKGAEQAARLLADASGKLLSETPNYTYYQGPLRELADYARDHARSLDTEGLRRHFLVEDLFQPEQATLTYSQIDRIIVGGIQPVNAALLPSWFS